MGTTKPRIALAAVLLAFAVAAHAADCFTEYQLVSEHGIQPNRPAGAAAWNGSLLAVARINNGSPVVLTRYDVNLNPVGESVVSSSPAAGPALLLSGGNEFAILFLSTSGRIIFQQITPDGARDGGEVTIGAAHGVFANQEFDFAYNPQLARWEIVYTVPTGADLGLWVTSIRTGAAPTDIRLQFFISDTAAPRIAVANNGISAISWFRPNNNTPTLFVGLYDASFAPVSSLLVATTAQFTHLATTGTSFALVYQAPISGGTELRWIRFDTTGHVIAADARLLVGNGVDVAPVFLLWNPALSEWALTYIDATVGLGVFPGDYRIRRLSPSGALISDALFTPDITKAIIAGRTNFVWNGSYTGSIERFVSPAEGSDSYLVKHCPLLADIHAENPTPVILQPFTFTASASGGLPPYTYRWDFGDLSEQRSETVFRHGYQRTGTYDVTLTVTDALGDRAVVTKTLTVLETVRRRPTRH